MKKVLLFSFIVLMGIACQKTQEKTEEATATTTDANIETIALKDFDKLAANYVNKEINIKGVVDHVCKHSGKKIFLVGEGANLHAYSDQRFDESLNGNEIMLTGIVEETRIDEASCQKMEEDGIKSHKEGTGNEDELKQREKQISFYRDSMKAAGTDHISFYELKYVSHKVLPKETEQK
jgi:hypothetical protein